MNLIKYPRETIIFHNVVTKNLVGSSSLYCSAQGDSILHRYNLDTVPIKVEAESYTSYDDLCDNLHQICQEVAKSSLASSEEGEVIKLISTASDESREIISMFKVKSLEFQALSSIVHIL